MKENQADENGKVLQTTAARGTQVDCRNFATL
jgi:hypothetical protein